MFIKNLTLEQKRTYETAIKKGYLDDYDSNPSEWKRSFVGKFISKYPRRTKTLDVLKCICGKIPTWEDVTDDVISEFVDEYKQTHSANSVRTAFAELRATINKDTTRTVQTKMYKEMLKTKSVPSQAVFLDEQEVSMIFDYYPRTENERIIKKLFLISAYTGARLCDAVNITINNCDHRTDTVSYVSEKTKTEVRLPVHRNLMKVLNMDVKIKSRSVQSLTVTYERAIRSMCKKCEIDDNVTLFRKGKMVSGPKWKFISSHTARRSFATNLYLNGVEPSTIAQFMGHSSPEITYRRYIVARRAVDENAMRFFK